MNKFLLFIGGLIAFFILLANLGPMVIFGLSIWLLYIVFKKFLKSHSTAGKIGWIIVGLVIVSIALANIYALLGVAAMYVIYLIIKNWKETDDPVVYNMKDDDPFTNFEREWANLNR